MSKAIKMGQDSARGGFWLFIGKIISVVVLAFGTIILGLFIGEAEYGLYAIAVIPSVTLMLFQDWGTSTALTKYCAQFRATDERRNLGQLIKAGMTFSFTSGLLLTILSLLLANFLAISVFDKPEAALYITIASSTLLSTSILVSAQSVFVGFEKMKYFSIVIICQAVVQSSLSPILVIMGYGTLGAIIGYTVALIIAAFLSMGLLYFGIMRKLPKLEIKPKMTKMLKLLLNYGVPLGISTILGGIVVQFYSFMMAANVGDILIGNYRMATNFAIFVTFFTVPIATVLFPTFSKINPKHELPLLKSVFSSSVKITALFIMPATLAMVILSEPIVASIYGDRWSFASLFLALSVLHNLFSFFGTLSINSLLTALGETKMLMKMNILVICLGVPLSFLIIPQFGIAGVILVSILAISPSALFSVYWTWKKYGVKADFKNSGKLLFASCVSAFITWLFLNMFTVNPWIELILGTILFLSTYLCCVPLFGAINHSDVGTLRTMFSGLGIISTMLEIPLLIMSKISKLIEK